MKNKKMAEKNNKDIKKENNRIIIIAILIIALILDQISKIIAYTQGYTLTSSSSNEDSGYYIMMSIIIILLIIRYILNDNTYIKLDTKCILSLATAGIIGNLIDRIWYKDIIVFIRLGNNLNMNFAYFYILVAWIGMALILTKNTMKMLKERKNKKVIKNEYEKNRNK